MARQENWLRDLIAAIEKRLYSPPWFIEGVAFAVLVGLWAFESTLQSIYIYIVLPFLQLLAEFFGLKSPWHTGPRPSLAKVAVVLFLFTLGSVGVAVVAERLLPSSSR